MSQDGLAEGLGALQLGIQLGFKVVDNGELVFNSFDYCFLFRKWD